MNLLYITEQIPVLMTLGRAALSSLGSKKDEAGFVFSPKEFQTTCTPPSPGLVQDYVKSCGGNAADYKGTLPFHLFPQWGFPPLMRTLSDLPYSLTAIMNGGCTVKLTKPLSSSGPLDVTARLVSLDEGERRVILTQELITKDTAGNSIEVTQTSIVRRTLQPKKNTQPKEEILVPDNAREVASFHAHAQSGLEYAFFSGDFNPIHYLPPYAQAFGFKRPILHGFAQLGRIYESLRKNVFAGAEDPLSEISIRFEKPLFLPQTCRVFLTDDGDYFLGVTKGAMVISRGHITAKKTKEIL